LKQNSEKLNLKPEFKHLASIFGVWRFLKILKNWRTTQKFWRTALKIVFNFDFTQKINNLFES